jgi:hypothetical protein
MLRTLVIVMMVAVGGCYPATGPAPGDTAEQERFWTTQPEDVRIEALRREMTETCPLADPAEVEAVAGVAVRYGELVRDEYDLTRPPEYNNVAVALGLKGSKRGRCYELADDLYIRLRAMRLQTLQLHRAIAKEGHLTDEHNVVIVTDVGEPIETGIILDLWRYAGKTRFLAVAKDFHKWKERPITAPPPAELVEDDITPGAAATP